MAVVRIPEETKKLKHLEKVGNLLFAAGEIGSETHDEFMASLKTIDNVFVGLLKTRGKVEFQV